MDGTRRTYKCVDGVFVEVPFSSLNAGDLFKLVDECDEPYEIGINIYKATSSLSKDGSSISAVNIKEASYE